eukprot:1158426-Pelagomonas_calceolata.AAC.12
MRHQKVQAPGAPGAHESWGAVVQFSPTAVICQHWGGVSKRCESLLVRPDACFWPTAASLKGLPCCAPQSLSCRGSQGLSCSVPKHAGDCNGLKDHSCCTPQSLSCSAHYSPQKATMDSRVEAGQEQVQDSRGMPFDIIWSLDDEGLLRAQVRLRRVFHATVKACPSDLDLPGQVQQERPGIIPRRLMCLCSTELVLLCSSKFYRRSLFFLVRLCPTGIDQARRPPPPPSIPKRFCPERRT